MVREENPENENEKEIPPEQALEDEDEEEEMEDRPPPKEKDIENETKTIYDSTHEPASYGLSLVSPDGLVSYEYYSGPG